MPTPASYLYMYRSMLLSLALLLWLPLPLSTHANPAAPTDPVDALLTQAEESSEKQNWADAQARYDEARELKGDWHSPQARLAVEGGVACAIQLQLWDDALERAQTFITENRSRFEEVVGERFLANLYLTIPHQGTKQGGIYYRGQYKQGVHIRSFTKDRKLAIQHYEKAVSLVDRFQQELGKKDHLPDTEKFKSLLLAEKIGIQFDLVAALSLQDDGYYGYGRFGWCGWWWASWDAEEDSDALEEADYEQPRWGRGHHWNQQQTPPQGLPIGPDGKPHFPPTPKAYSASLGDSPKIRYLLENIQQIDPTSNKDHAARALYQRAMIFRSLYGPEIRKQWQQRNQSYNAYGQPTFSTTETSNDLKPDHELLPDEAITIVGGKLRVITLPAEENPLALLQQVREKYPASNQITEAAYAQALYHQSRQNFPTAVALYQQLQETYPKHSRANAASAQIRSIRQPSLVLDRTRTTLPDTPYELAFKTRNTSEVKFQAQRFDLVSYVKDQLTSDEDRWRSYNFEHYLFNQDRYQAYLEKDIQEWSQPLPENPDLITQSASTIVPVTAPGAYIITGTVGNNTTSKALLIITDIAVVHKHLTNRGLIYLTDARTGQSLKNQPVEIFENWSEYIQTKQKSDYKHLTSLQQTNEAGAIEYKKQHTKHGVSLTSVVSLPGNRIAVSFLQNWSEHNPSEYYDNGPRIYVITDRPVYRPGDTVKFHAWIRTRNNGKYEPVSAGMNSSIEVYDAKNNRVLDTSIKTDTSGSISAEYQIPADDPALGVYSICVRGYQPDSRYNGGGMFRVEEYKKPEFSVTVKPAKTQARLGETVTAEIQADYYFGAPVASGEVTYKVFRETYNHVYWGPAEYDWLYGKGYGRYLYPYDWFPWWHRWGGYLLGHFWPHYGHSNHSDYQQTMRRTMKSGTRRALRELVAQGKQQLNADGTCEIKFDTADALRDLPNSDHRYTIEAEVRDASRRTITGQGDVIVTRQEFYAFVETRQGWYRPGNEAFLDVRTLTPDNVPVASKGRVTVSRIRYEGDDRSSPTEEEVKSWKASTDAQGRLSIKVPLPGEGQYRVTYQTRDSWKQEVLGNAIFWVCGPKFDGRIYRFNHLEIIADKREYQPGDTAHLLINTDQNHSRILFSDQVSQGVLRDYRFIDLPQRSTMIDIPITESHLPNFFVEATLVRDGRVHMERQELFVPPSHNLMQLSLKTDKETYRPGEEGTVEVTLRDFENQPVSGNVTLTAYDKSVTYIQNEFGPSPKVFYYGQRRQHTPFVHASLNRTYNIYGSLTRPHDQIYHGGLPEGWQGTLSGSISNGGGGLTLSGAKLESKNESNFGYGSRREDQLGLSRQSAAKPAAMPMSTTTSPMKKMKQNRGRSSLDAMSDRSEIASEASGFINYGAPVDGIREGEQSKDEDSGWFGSLFSSPLVDPAIRQNFADTALWLPNLQTDKNGKATTTITFPDSLTTWRLRGYAVTNDTKVADTTAEATTSKNLIVRLQTPRFFIERDEVVLSANVHNYLDKSKNVTAELIIPAAYLKSLDSPDLKPDENGMIRLTAKSKVKANGETRFDWTVKAHQEGLARITVKALTDKESDAMQMAFPVLVHGVDKTVAQSGSYRVADSGSRTLNFDLPTEINPEQSKLEVTLAPSLGGVMIDALPYLTGYPYGCVEQTMSRFYPSVLVKDTLKRMGTNLEAIGEQRRQIHQQDLEHRFGKHSKNPVYDSEELDKMVDTGLRRIASFQRGDGGWGWWREDDSSPYQTAYVIMGLHTARKAGAQVNGNMFQRGVQYLQHSIRRELKKDKDDQRLGSLQTQAYIAYVLALTEHISTDETKAWLQELHAERGKLNNYGKSLLALAFHLQKDEQKAKLLLENVLQFAERDDSNETAWIRTPQKYWWFWWNNDIETNAWALKALATIEPQHDLSPRLVKWLLNNRRNGHYWRSTRDTALVISAMTDYMHTSGESDPDYTLVVKLNGKPVKEVHVTSENFFTFDNRVVLYGLQIEPGQQTLTIEKEGTGALYYSAYLSYFTEEENIQGAGNEIFIDRKYYRLQPKAETVTVPGKPAFGIRNNWFGWFGGDRPAGEIESDETAGRKELRAGYERIPLASGDAVTSGELIEVVLKITAKNTYDYLAFEDMKPAGCEPVELRSGGRFAGGLCPNVELRDEKTVFFIGLLEQGEHILRYKLRAETPGIFHALPTSGYAMYAPEIKAISDEMLLQIHDE